jgi:hypothetical protein
MKSLTSVQRSALHLAARKGGANLADGKIRRQTANLLALREWVTIVNGVVLITKAGRAELQKPLPEGPAIYLALGGSVKYKTLPSGRQVVEDQGKHDPIGDHGYTTNRGRAADDLESGMIPPRADWAEHSAKLHEASCADVDATRLSGLPHPEDRLAELRRMGLERGIDVKDELRYVSHSLKVLER